ncbi:MAG: MerR family transcriptional regulator [Propioniciclava sp.]
MTVVPIGRFSKMTRLSVKALRLYADIGLLEPAEVDPSSGYRYYDLTQAGRAEAIRTLRSVEMPLDEIRIVLNADEPAQVHDLLLAHRERLARRLADQERMLAYLENLIRKGVVLMPYDIHIRRAEPVRVAAVKVTTSLRTVSEDIDRSFATLIPAITMAGLTPAGPPVLVYHDVIDEETSGGIEVCVPIAGDFAGRGESYSRELEGGAMASTVHRGPYREIGPAYHAVTEWVAHHGHEIAGPPRETYLNHPNEVAEQDLLTRVDFPLRSAT